MYIVYGLAYNSKIESPQKLPHGDIGECTVVSMLSCLPKHVHM